MGRSQFNGHRAIYILLVVAVLVSNFDAALADETPGNAFRKLRPVVKSDAAFWQIRASALDLALTGTITGAKSIAFIRVAGAPDKLFTVGEAITPNVQLLAVGLFGAVISHDGVPERLEFSGSANTSPVTIADSQEPAAVQPRLFKTGRIVAFTPSEAVHDLGNSRFSVNRSFVNDQLQSGDLLLNARMQPDGSGGFRITEIVPGSLYDTLGLRDGDVISAGDGKGLTSVADLATFVSEQGDPIRTVKVQFTRDGELNNLQLDFK